MAQQNKHKPLCKRGPQHHVETFGFIATASFVKEEISNHSAQPLKEGFVVRRGNQLYVHALDLFKQLFV